MSKTVAQVIDDVIRREGGYVDHPNDRGGPTKYGITQKTLDAYSKKYDIFCMPVKDLSVDKTRMIYRNEYYPSVAILASEYQPQVFDMCVNHGPRTAIKIIQRACQDDLVIDGILGPKTAKAVSRSLTNKAIAYARMAFYAKIVANDHTQIDFLKGWLNRAEEFL